MRCSKVIIVVHALFVFLALGPYAPWALSGQSAGAFKPVRTLDDFEVGGRPVGLWWDSDGSIVYQRTIVQRSPISGRYVMEVVFDKKGRPWSFFAFHPTQDGTNNDFWGFTDIFVWMYSEARVTAIVKVEDNSGGFSEVEVELTPGRWTPCALRLSGVNKRSIRNILFFLEPGQSYSSGAVLLDFLCLASRDVLAYISPTLLRVPNTQSARMGGRGTYELRWSYPGPQPWLGLYEVWIDTDRRFTKPVRVFTTEQRWVISDIPLGTYYWRVRAWTGLPQEWGYWGQPSDWSRAAVLTVTPFETVRILANFDGQDSAILTWWDIDGTEVYDRRISEGIAHTGSRALSVTYRKTPGYEWSCFGLTLCQDGVANDLTQYDELIFWIYPQEHELAITLKIVDSLLSTWEQFQVASHVNQWQVMIFDLRDARERVNLRNVRDILFFPAPGQGHVAGSFFLDDLLLVSRQGFKGVPSRPVLDKTPRRGARPFSLQLSWSNESASGAIFYELLESTSPDFRVATSYLTSDTTVEIVKGSPGEYYYKIRSWTHLSKYGGQASDWSDVVRGRVEPAPLRIKTVRAFSAGGERLEYACGSTIRISVVTNYPTSLIREAKVRISSKSCGYDSGTFDLVRAEDGLSHFAHWATRGLKPGGDYRVFVTITALDGSIARDESLLIRLKQAVPVVISLPVVKGDTPAHGGLLAPFIRFYNSAHASTSGVLGYGWSSNYHSQTNQHLREYGDGSVGLMRGGGIDELFVRNPDGSYVSTREPALQSKLTRTAGGEFELRGAHGTVFSFDAQGRLRMIADGKGNHVTFDYFPTGFLRSAKDSSGRRLEFGYFQNKLAWVIDPAGRKTSYFYDPSGNLAETVGPSGSSTRYEYDHRHFLTAIKEATGRKTYFEYDNEGRITSYWYNDFINRVCYEYDDSASAITVRDSLGGWVTYSYNVLGKIEQIKDAAGRTVAYGWDDTGNLIEVVNSRGHVLSLSYDAGGNLAAVRDPTGNEARIVYDLLYNMPTRVSDITGRTVVLEYDPFGNLLATTDPLGNVTYFENDSLGRLVSVRDALGRTTRYEYNSQGQLVVITYPDGTSIRTEWDAVDNITAQANRDGSTVRFIISDTDRLLAKILPDGSRAEYEWNGLQQLTAFGNSAGRTLYRYDDAGRLVEIKYPSGLTLTYAYDMMSRIVRVVYPYGRSFTYTYDVAGRLTAITNDGTGEQFTYAYDEFDRLTQLSLPNGFRTVYEYDVGGEILSVEHLDPAGIGVQRYRYGYGPSGERSWMETDEGTYFYTYNARGELVGVRRPDGRDLIYEYDALGNRRLTRDGGGVVAYSVNDLNQYTEVGGTSYSYDKNGNITSRSDGKGTTSYRYDWENRLIEIRHADGGVTRYEYDALGRRTKEVKGDRVVQYLLDADGRIIMTLDDQGGILSTFLWGPGPDELLAEFTDAEIFYYQRDGLDSVVLITDHEGTVVERYAYDPFGVPVVFGSDGSPVEKPLVRHGCRFTGKPYDWETGLYFFGARYYDPRLGRFISPDPLFSLRGTNLYVYCGNDPVNYVDRLGLVEEQYIMSVCAVEMCFFKKVLQRVTTVVKRVVTPVVRFLLPKKLADPLIDSVSRFFWALEQLQWLPLPGLPVWTLPLTIGRITLEKLVDQLKLRIQDKGWLPGGWPVWWKEFGEYPLLKPGACP